MKILLLTTDELTAQFDRRIVDLAECIINNGDQVVIQTIGRTAKLGNIEGHAVVQFPRHFKKTSAEEARIAFFNETSFGKEADLADEARLKNFARAIWSRLPTRLKPHVHSVYSKVILLSSGLKDVNPKYLADSYFSDAYSFYEANYQVDYDIVIGTDITSGIAATLLTAGSKKSWWYEAHEFATEQQWLKDHHGFTTELITIEKQLVKTAHVFSSVSEKLVMFMEETFGRDKQSIVLHNSTRSRQVELNLQNSLPKSVLDTFQLPDRIIMFHGVLSDLRGLSKFVEAFESASIPNWKFVLIGYNPGIELQKTLKRAKNSILLNAVNSEQVGEIVRMSDVVLMPYPVLDINTKYGFANKLGDCIAEKVPFLYNKDLEAIDEVAASTNTGVPFSWSDLSNPGELKLILKDFQTLTPDWKKAERLFGWTNFETTIFGLLSEIKREI
jgi:glycosyltransferase involved in cell wall biosynthesis